jgi:hypothetical protein
MAINHARRRRARTAFYLSVTLAAASASAYLLSALASRYSARIDVTATGSQRLAERTMRVLKQLDRPYEVVVATDFSLVDRRSKERLADVLNEYSRSSPHVTFSFIDTATASGARAFRDLVGRLASRESDVLTQQRAAIELHLGAIASLATYFSDTLSSRLLDIEGQIPAVSDAARAQREFFSQSAAASRILSRDLATASATAADAMRATVADVNLPQTDVAGAALAQALAPALEHLASLDRELTRFTSIRDQQGPATDAAGQLVGHIRQQRDRAAVVLDALRNLRRPNVLRIVDTLRSGSASLVLGPSEVGASAIDLAALLPSTAWLDATGAAKADQNRRVEELLSTAIASLLNKNPPIVVLVHGEPQAFLSQVPIVTLMRQRLEFRGADLLEWPAVLSQDPPPTHSIDPEQRRPVIYASLSPNTSAPAAERGGLTGIQRAQRLGAVMRSLVESGRNVLISINPSVLPTYGDADPFSPAMAHFGITAETGRPLLRETLSAGVRSVETDFILQADDTQHPISAAMRGLPTFIAWPLALFARGTPDQSVRITHTTLLSLPASPTTWLESQWLRLWQTPRDQRPLLSDPPRFDDARDGRWPEGRDTGQPQRWGLAIAAERFATDRPTQRAVVMGSNNWFIDAITGQQVALDGRRVPSNPGNLELFEAAVSWLAGQDELIAQSPSAKAAPIVSPIDDEKATRIRLALILGLPILSLLAGLFYRVLRR